MCNLLKYTIVFNIPNSEALIEYLQKTVIFKRVRFGEPFFVRLQLTYNLLNSEESLVIVFYNEFTN
jgi:hypothetical protein